MPAYSPDAIKALFNKVDTKYPGVRNGGILANKPGYHNARSRLPRDDYSVTEARDKKGDPDAASAIDITPDTPALQQKLSKRLMDASLKGDARLKPVREWFGSLDSKKVTGYSLLRKRKVSSDKSHLWHIHISFHRDSANDKAALSRVADVLLGVNSEPPPPPTPAPVPLAADIKLPAITGAVMTKAFELQRVMDMPVATGLQGFESFGSGWILGQSVDATVGEDSIFNRFNSDRKYVDRMVCKGAGHNSAFAVSGPYVWMAWDKISGGKIVDHRLARIRYGPGTVKDSDPDITFYDPFTSTQYMHPAMDSDHSRLALRAASKFILHDVKTFKAGTNKPLASVTVSLPGPFQGFAAYGNGLWIASGETNGTVILSEYSWSTGKQTAELNLTGMLRSVDAKSFEPQGVWCSRGDRPVLHVGARFGSAAKRRFIVFKIATLTKEN